MLCGSLDGKEIWERMDTCICMAESLCSPPERNWQPTPIALPGEFHGQRSLKGYSLWGGKELDMTEQLTHTHTWLSLSGVYLKLETITILLIDYTLKQDKKLKKLLLCKVSGMVIL